ncbi:hypothetical protein [Cryobacterium sp. Y82]|uniref:DUF7657 domain-containing protein n=1 Tax=Cryobacterium sp. Y82 TaxID=2045017 RepID=UPI000CE4AACD|nr:hypothetical protein [Cryobacterium sp. Y82]
MTVLNELPSWDWSSIFRPHLWGYLFFGLDAGMAWQWWIPALVLVSACYMFAVTLMPRRPLTSAFLAVAVFFTPFLQWWYTPSSVMSVGWPLLAMAAVVWILVDDRRWVRVVWSIAVGYFAITLAMGLYVPFIIPGLMVFIAFAVGYLFRARPWAIGGARATWGRLAPLLAAGVGAIAVTAIWAGTRISTFNAIQSTVYPGQRFDPTGSLIVKDPYLAGIGGAPWSQALKSTSGTTILGLNSSEASSVILLCFFVLPGLLWFVLQSLRKSQRTDWLLISVLACLGLILAYLFIPGWDELAHIIQLDRIPAERFRIVFVVLLPLVAVLTIEHIDRFGGRANLIVGAVCAAFTAAMILGTALRIRELDSAVLAAAPSWKIIAVLLVVATLLLFVKSSVPVAVALLLAASVVMSIGVNPLYRGVFDLSETATGTSIEESNDEDPGTWVGVGSFEAMALLVESGVQSLSGVQTYPSKEMWSAIDPSGKFETEWNRLGHVQWAFGAGEPTVVNPQPDVISVTFDPCSTFAQENVSYVLTDGAPNESSCLVENAVIPQGTLVMRVYEIVPGN